MANKSTNIAAKIFAVVSLLVSLVMALLIYLAWKSLQAPIDAATAATRFNTLSNPVFYINLYLFLFNLGLAVWLKARRNRSLYFFFGLFIFVLFANVHLFWLSDEYTHFKQQYKMWHGETNMSGIFAIALAVMAAFVSGVGFFIGSWLHHRTTKKTTDA